MRNRFSYSQREFETVPLSRWACGPTSLLNCMLMLGNAEVTFQDVLDAAGTTRWRQERDNIRDGLGSLLSRWLGDRPILAGMDEDVLAAAARTLGYRAVPYSGRARNGVEAWARLVEWGEACTPAAVSVGNGGHWAVVYGATAKGAWVFDPNFSVADDLPIKFWSRTRFLRRWWNSGEDEQIYYAIKLTPGTATTRAMQRRGQVPPGKLAFKGSTRATRTA